MALCEQLGFALLDLAASVVFGPHRRPWDRPRPADISLVETEDLRAGVPTVEDLGEQGSP